MNHKINAALCQLNISPDVQENLWQAEAMLRAAAQAQAELAVLPEMFICPYLPQRIIDAAEPPGGPTIQRLSALAAELQLVLIAGSIAEQESDGRIYNTSYCLAPDGSVLGCYRKVHLFDVDIPGRIHSHESSVISPGSGGSPFIWRCLKLAVNICFDIRFPALAQSAAQQGAEILAVPAQFSSGTGPDHWELLLRARALDNQCYVLGANAAYDPQAKYRSWGHSLIVDPWGRVLAQAGSEPALLTAELDLAYLAQVRRELPLTKLSE